MAIFFLKKVTNGTWWKRKEADPSSKLQLNSHSRYMGIGSSWCFYLAHFFGNLLKQLLAAGKVSKQTV